MEPDFVIERGNISHLDDIMEIENTCFGPDSFSRRQMAYLLTRAKGIFYIIRRKEKVAAYISLVYRSNASNLRIYSIAVHPSERGRHLAQALMDQSAAYAGEMQLSSLTLEVNTQNTAAISLYTRNGFEIDAVLPGYYPDGDAFRMKKLLQRQQS